MWNSGERSWRLTDALFLWLLAGTIAFGKDFSALGVELAGVPVYITEVVLIVFCAPRLLLRSRAMESVTGKLVVLYLLWCGLQTFRGLAGGYGLLALRDAAIGWYALAFFMGYELAYRNDSWARYGRRFSAALMISLIATSLLFSTRGDAAVHPILKYANGYNYGLILGIAFYWVILLRRNDATRKLLTLWIVAVVILLQVRTIWVAFLTAFLVFLAWVPVRRSRKLTLVLATASVLLLAVVAVSVYLPQMERRAGGFAAEIGGVVFWTEPGTLQAGTARGRVQLWEYALRRSYERHPIIGSGFTYILEGLELANVSSSGLQTVGITSGYVPLHNGHLTLLYKTGIVGYLIYVIINLSFVVGARRELGKAAVSTRRKMLACCLLSVVFCNAAMLFFEVMTSPHLALFLWTPLGVGASLIAKNSEHRTT